MKKITLYLEYYNKNDNSFVGEFDINSKFEFLKLKKILNKETWLYYDPQQLDENNFNLLNIYEFKEEQVKFEDYDWFFQFRTD